MKLSSHYIRLRQHFPQAGETEQIAVTIDELAEALDCTHRNVVLILKRMASNHWLQWNPRKGRGNRSVLLFLIRNEEIMLQAAKEMVERKDIRGAMEQIKGSSVSAAVKDNFNDWLYHYFGHSTELKDDKRIDTLRFPLNQPLHTLDPLNINFTSESHVVNQIFDSLVRNNPLTESIEPHLAHAWEVDDTRTVWIFHLRKGVQFHNGREMTANDALYSLNRLRYSTNRSLYRWVYSQIKQVEVLDSYTVQIQLYEANELFLTFLSTNRASIVPSEVSAKHPENFGRMPMGTGPFKLTQNDHSMCVLEAFPYYFQGRAHLDRVEIWHIPDLYNQIGNAFLERTDHPIAEQPGSLQIKQSGSGYPPLAKFQIIHNVRLPNEESNAWNQVQQVGTTCKFLTFNLLKHGPLGNPELRKALYHAIDRNQIMEKLAGDVIYPTDGFISREKAQIKAVDHKQAVDLLRETGYSGETLELCTIPNYEHDALLVQDTLRQVGVDISISLLPASDFKGDLRLKADLLLFAVMLDNDVELRLIDLYKSMQQHLQPSLNSLLEQKIALILQEPSATTRKQHFKEIEHALVQHECLLFLYQKHLKTLYHPSVKGISVESLGWVQFSKIWFLDASLGKRD